MRNKNVDVRGEKVGKKLGQDLQTYLDPLDNLRSPKSWRRLLVQFHRHPGMWAVVVYRFGQWTRFGCRLPLVSHLLQLFYLLLFYRVRTHWQIEIPATATIDGGLHIYHFGGIIINGDTVAGRNLSINHGVVIGNGGKDEAQECPRLGDNVTIHLGAKLFGGIEIGNNVEVGACSLVIKSFPDNAVVAGVPARVLRTKSN